MERMAANESNPNGSVIIPKSLSKVGDPADRPGRQSRLPYV